MNKDLYIFPEKSPLGILDSKSSVCIANIGKEIKQIRHISRRVHFVKNGENFKIHKINWCKGGLELAEIATNNVGDNDLNPRTNSILVRLDNWDITIVQEGWQDTW